MQLGYFHNTKNQRDFKSTLAFLASHEARRRMTVFSIQLAGNYTRPTSRGTRRATAVKPRPSRMSLYVLAPYGRDMGSRGTAPCASHEARCRMAVFSIQLAGNYTRPASRGTRRATAVKPRPSRMSFECSRALWARSGVQGVTPCAQSERGLSPLGCRRGGRCPERGRSPR